MAGRIAKEFNVELQLEQLYSKQTIKDIAAEIDKSKKKPFQKIIS